jgi:DNA repair exonuclease SbcCD ATPase subunit
VLSRLDARVADINHRTELAQASTSELLEQLASRLEQTNTALDAHAAAARAAAEARDATVTQRIADLSTQIADVSVRLERLRGLIDAYAEAAVEVASQSNHELRRLGEAVAALELPVDDQATDQPVG